MSVITTGCGLCKGQPMTRLEERTEGGAWVHNTMLSPEIADAWIAAGDAPLRWADADCPRCDGRGEYEIESTACKIF